MKRLFLFITLLTVAGYSFGQSTINGLPGQSTTYINANGAGAASTPGLTVSGAPYTGGTGTTNLPQLYINNGSTAPTTFSTSGTEFGINAPSGFSGNLVDTYVNGSSVLSIDQTGNITTQGSQIYGDGGVSYSPWNMFGAIYTGGTGTTTLPYFIYQPSSGATAVTTWSTAGTVFGANTGTGFTGNLIDLHVNGSGSLFSVNSTGQIGGTGNTTYLSTTPGTISSTSPVTATLAFPIVPASTNKVGHCEVLWSQATGSTSTFSLHTSAAPTDMYAGSQAYGSALTIFQPVTVTTATTTAVSAAIADSSAGVLNHLKIDVSIINGATANTITLYAQVTSGSDVLTINKGSTCTWEP